MARPFKQGLDYFPLDVDIDQDDKFQLIEALHGLKGFGITLKLMMRIYKDGYFYRWSEMEQILFSKRVNVDINDVINVVNDCIKYSIFDKGLYEKYEILTSLGIQKRYFEAIKRRKDVEISVEYLLIDVKNIVNANINKVNVNINTQEDDVNDDISTQRKGKERKEEESKEDSPSKKIFDHYISKNIISHGKITSAMSSAINARLKDYSFEQLIQAIDNYATIYPNDDYWFSTKYSLADLMRDKDVRKFIDDAEPLKNFLDKKWGASNGVNRTDNAKDAERQARIDETNARRARLIGIEPD